MPGSEKEPVSISVSQLLGVDARVDGVPTHALAQSGKDDIVTMQLCCESEAATYWKQPEGHRLCAAPFYFERLAILHRKSGNYADEVAICEQWKVIIGDYKSQPMVKAKRAALVHKGPRSIAILARLPKAKELLRKQKAEARRK